jgi:hypothetical protein
MMAELPDGAGAPGSIYAPAVGAGTATTTGSSTDGQGGTDAAGGGRSGGAKGGGGSGDGPRSGVRGESKERGPVAGLVPRAPSPTDITIPLLLLAVALMAVVGWRIQRRRGPIA